MTAEHPHGGQPVMQQGAKLEQAKRAVIMLHGRGANPQSILTLAPHFDVDGTAFLAPTAAGSTWYPYPFVMPRSRNEPFLSSALRAVSDVVDTLTEAGMQREQIVILGFSQGACLALEFAVRNPQRYGGIAAFSGGLIGADGELSGYNGSLDDTPIFIGCSDQDAHIPEPRVHESADILKKLGADVTTRIYPGMGHTINEDEVAFVHDMIAGIG